MHFFVLSRPELLKSIELRCHRTGFSEKEVKKRCCCFCVPNWLYFCVSDVVLLGFARRRVPGKDKWVQIWLWDSQKRTWLCGSPCRVCFLPPPTVKFSANWVIMYVCCDRPHSDLYIIYWSDQQSGLVVSARNTQVAAPNMLFYWLADWFFY